MYVYTYIYIYPFYEHQVREFREIIDVFSEVFATHEYNVLQNAHLLNVAEIFIVYINLIFTTSEI
jgi:hypothetical protein